MQEVQISGLGTRGEFILSVLAKRTYTLTPGGTLSLARVQLPLRTEGIFDDERAGLLVADLEIYPLKLLTDIVVRGHAYLAGKPERLVEVQIGDAHRRIVACGERTASLRDGRIVFSGPLPIDRVPLTYDRAYGGRDRRTEEKRGHPFARLAPYAHASTDLDAYSPFVYPRNRHGRGYLFEVSDEALAELLLPNLEDPADRLTPDRLLVPDPEAWWSMPVPAGTTWIPPSYFGRGVFGGMFPFWKPLPETLPEFTRGLLPREVAEVDLFAGHPLCRRMANGASLGLLVPPPPPGARIRLAHVHPRIAELVLTLPAGLPRISVDGREGALLPTEPVLHHVEIEPDLDRVSIVWRGAAPARRAYHPTELARMPFRVEWPEGM